MLVEDEIEYNDLLALWPSLLQQNTKCHCKDQVYISSVKNPPCFPVTGKKMPCNKDDRIGLFVIRDDWLDVQVVPMAAFCDPANTFTFNCFLDPVWS